MTQKVARMVGVECDAKGWGRKWRRRLGRNVARNVGAGCDAECDAESDAECKITDAFIFMYRLLMSHAWNMKYNVRL